MGGLICRAVGERICDWYTYDLGMFYLILASCAGLFWSFTCATKKPEN